MDAGIVMAAAIVGASIVGSFILTGFIIYGRRNEAKSSGEDTADLVRLAEEKARTEAELASTRADLTTANQELNNARQFQIQNAKLETDLANERTINGRVSKELNSVQSRRDELQFEVQDLTAKVSNLKTQLENAEERLVERGELEKLFGDRFKTMSSETLANQQKHFIERARETLKPLSDKVEKLDREWVNTSGAFRQQVSSLADQTRALSSALSKPQGRGQWGEIQVERVLEFSGLQKDIHYEAQAPDMQGGRTDFIVHMPHNRDIILDSKVSLVAYVDAHEAESDEERNAHLERFARHFQTHVNELASKEYWRNLPKAADYVVMVVPDYALPEAIARRPNLIDVAHSKNVVISSQSNLVALLKTVAMGWQERKLTEEAYEIGAMGRELHDRIEVFARHYAQVGRELASAITHYNKGVGSLESNVLVQARRFPELGIQTTKEISETQPIETTIRPMRTLPSNYHPENQQ